MNLPLYPVEVYTTFFTDKGSRIQVICPTVMQDYATLHNEVSDLLRTEFAIKQSEADPLADKVLGIFERYGYLFGGRGNQREVAKAAIEYVASRR
jgi:hypothetical protein